MLGRVAYYRVIGVGISKDAPAALERLHELFLDKTICLDNIDSTGSKCLCLVRVRVSSNSSDGKAAGLVLEERVDDTGALVACSTKDGNGLERHGGE